MRAPLIRLGCLLSTLIATTASAVTIAWTPIGNPSNAADDTGFGSVGYAYSIGTYEVTNAQYAEFLNAKAATADPFSLWAGSMGFGQGGISRSGSAGNYSYNVIAGRGEMPVGNVSFMDAIRFANWMNNGQGAGDTESGAYTLTGGSSDYATNAWTVTRNPGATIAVPSENEWYKAAYYDPSTLVYFDYPAGSNSQTICAAPTAVPNRANCSGAAASDVTIKGSYIGSASPYGTYDQGGNVWEWNESIIDVSNRGRRGGYWAEDRITLGASYRGYNCTACDGGLRLVLIPEPSTVLLVIAGLLGLAGWRRARA